MSFTEVILIIECRNMKEPKVQRPRFDQTILDGAWRVVEHEKVVKNSNSTVTTTSKWTRQFGKNKDPQTILKLTKNLLKRASGYSHIEDYLCTLIIGANEPVEFSSF